MLRGGRRFAGMMLVALLGACVEQVTAQNDEPEPPIVFNISRGPLAEAISQFSQQSGVQFTANFGGQEVRERVVDGINESLPARTALDRILKGSGLTARWHSRKTVRIYPMAVPRAFDDVNEVLVTGSRIDDGGEGPAPVRVYSREDIDRFGVSSVPGLAGYFTQQPFSFGEWAQRSGAQHFQMRGLGVDTTLVLINGRRAPPSATSVTLNAFDLNTIPLTAVERIEVMSDSASAIYGADAIGGVVNIILKKAVESPDLYLHYGAVAGGGEERRVAGSIGKSVGRFRSAFTLDYFERGMLVGAERSIWRNQDYRRFGGTDYRVSTANPANVYSLTGQPLPGLPTAQAAVPAGSTGVGLTPADFLETAGVVNLYSSNATWSVLPKLRRLSAFGSAEFQLDKGVSFFGEMLLARSDVLAQGDLPTLMGQVVPTENPYNPFGQPVAINYALVGMKPRSSTTDSAFARLVLGAKGQEGPWHWEFAFTGSDESSDSTTINDLDFARVQEAMESTEPQTALNPFADGPAGSDSLLSSLVGAPQEFDFSSQGLQLAGLLRRQLFKAPGGMCEFVFGGEWRREQVRFFNLTPLERERDVVSGFAEFKLPLLEELSVKLALRADDYEKASTSVNPQYGLVWRPARDWLVRAAYGTSFRPPSLPELFSPSVAYLTTVADPRRGDSLSAVRFSVGGNPDLENISGHSFTGGFVYRSAAWPGLQLGVHYWRVVMSNRIIIPRISDLGYLEDTLPDRVTRSAVTEADRLAGWPGTLGSVDASLLNYGRLKTKGIDLDLSYRGQGQFRGLQAALSATWVDEFSSQDMGTTLPEDRVGIANLQGTVPEWRLLGSLAWEGRGWAVSTTATFTPPYRDSDSVGVLDRQVPARTLIDIQARIELGQLFDAGLFDEFKVTVGVLNLLNKTADFANAGLMLGYDASQANLNGRLGYLRITKVF